MREPVSLDQAEYKSALAVSLFKTILEKACTKCSEVLLNYTSLACNLDQEIHRALTAEPRIGGTK